MADEKATSLSRPRPSGQSTDREFVRRAAAPAAVDLITNWSGDISFYLVVLLYLAGYRATVLPIAKWA